LYPASIPEAQDITDCIRLELSDFGGHVGFMAAGFPPRRWLEDRILASLSE